MLLELFPDRDDHLLVGEPEDFHALILKEVDRFLDVSDEKWSEMVDYAKSLYLNIRLHTDFNPGKDVVKIHLASLVLADYEATCD